MDGFSIAGFMPHGHCYLWNPTLVWTMVLSDTLIGLAYISISLCLYSLVRKIRLPFSGMFLAFGLFIAACGATHFFEVYTLWTPSYWLAAFIKVITATASVVTAIFLFPLMPKVVAFAQSVKTSEERRIQLEEKTVSLAAINSELEAFSYAVSHDLRSPLRSMLGFSNSLLEAAHERLLESDKEMLGRIVSAAERMGHLVEGLLDLSRVTGRDVKSESVDLSRMSTEIIEALKKDYPERKVETHVHAQIVVRGDQALLHAALTNLIHNAWKFTLKQPLAQIEFGKKTQNGSEVYYVRDNGAGFDMKDSGKLFEAFQRLHSQHEFDGNGIGLATVQRIIQRHGGRIWAEAQMRQGATFYFTLNELKG